MIWLILLAAGLLLAAWCGLVCWHLWHTSRASARVQRDRAGRIIAIVGTDTRRGLDGERIPTPRRYR
jgi:hypothetical protein